MLKRIRIENYRSIGEVDIELGPLTVLVGQNGSGKTNFVDAIHFLCDALTYGLDAAVMRRGGIGSIRKWARGRSLDVSIQVSVAPDRTALAAEYAMVVWSDADGAYLVKREALHATELDASTEFEACNERLLRSSLDPGPSERSRHSGLLAPLWPHPVSHSFTEQMREAGFYSILPDVLREPQHPAAEHPLDTHGSNVASVLRRIDRDHTDTMQRILQAMSAAMPQVQYVQVAAAGGYWVLRFGDRATDGSTHWFDSKQMSDGTLRMLGILAALYQEPPLSLVVIEEPELTIHPGMLAVLRDVIVEASQERSQVIITTHSPDLMNLFDVDVLRVVEMTEEGTKIGPVAEHQRQAVRENLFLPGELARIEGLARAQ